MLCRLLVVSAVLGAVSAVPVTQGASDLLPSHDQQPLLAPHSDAPLDVRRFPIQSENDAHQIIQHAKSHDLDIWSIDRQKADIYFASDAPVPSFFDARNFTSLSPTFEAEDSIARKRPKFPSVGPWNVTSISNCTFHGAYHTYPEILSFVQQLAEEYPKLVELVKVGRTSEGRDIMALTIGKTGGKRRKQRMVIQGAQHAREWIASATALYIAHSLVVSESDSFSKRHLLKRMDFTVIPLPNPDGYVYTWETDRLWYKNRQKVGEGKCKGLDLNRNWGYQWEPATDSDPCSHWYPGTQAFDALESRAIAAYIKRTPNIRAFLDLRSYGQIIMHPFSHSCKAHPADEENLMEAALGAAQALSKTHGTSFSTGSLCDKLYSAPGNIVDWMYAQSRVTMSYSVLLRDTGTHGFLLPAHLVRPVGEETANMVAYLALWIKVRKP